MRSSAYVLLPLLMISCASEKHAMFIGTEDQISHDPVKPSIFTLEDGTEETRYLMRVVPSLFSRVKITKVRNGMSAYSFRGGWHPESTGWIENGALIYENDFELVSDWPYESNLEYCDNIGCYKFDFSEAGKFEVEYADWCLNKKADGSCPYHCPITNRFEQPICKDVGEVEKARNLVRLSGVNGYREYFLEMGSELCWRKSLVWPLNACNFGKYGVNETVKQPNN